MSEVKQKEISKVDFVAGLLHKEFSVSRSIFHENSTEQLCIGFNSDQGPSYKMVFPPHIKPEDVQKSFSRKEDFACKPKTTIGFVQFERIKPGLLIIFLDNQLVVNCMIVEDLNLEDLVFIKLK